MIPAKKSCILRLATQFSSEDEGMAQADKTLESWIWDVACSISQCEGRAEAERLHPPADLCETACDVLDDHQLMTMQIRVHDLDLSELWLDSDALMH